MSGRFHDCVLCRAPRIAFWQACCPACWKLLPARLRCRLREGWQQRIQAPAQYSEALAAALLCYRERRPL